MNDPQLQNKRHSLAHLLAAAVIKLYPGAKRTIGPAIDNGFYYDFEFKEPITEKDLPKIEKEMKKLLKTWTTFERREVTADEAREIFKDNPYKLELIDEFSKEGQALTVKVLNFMRDRLQEYQNETGDIFNLEATPGEGTSRRFAWADKKQFPDIIVANEAEYKKGAQPFYTNSSQLPVNYTDDIVEAMNIQDGLQTRYTGGTVMHLFLGEKIEDIGEKKKKEIME